jgi:hypothetical protein
MRYELKGCEPIAGFSAHAAAEGQVALMAVKGFFTSEDGHQFYAMLDGLAAHFLGAYLDTKAAVSTIDHCLVFLRRDQSATVYVNHLPVVLTCTIRRAVQSGEPVFRSDIAGIVEFKLDSVEVPPDAAVLFYFSVGWRRGLYFDFMPMQGEPLGNLERVFGEMYERLHFAELYSVPSNAWPQIFATGWFPFVHLVGGPFEELLGFLERDIVPAWEEKIFARFDPTALETMVRDWRTVDSLREHLPFLEAGIERYLAGDYLSSISNLWPRVEGILRFVYSGPGARPGQAKLLENMRETLEKKTLLPHTFFPALFADYLLKFYYRDFALDGQEGADLTRHSHAHGVATAKDYDRKKALLGILIVHQLYYYLKAGLAKSSA